MTFSSTAVESYPVIKSGQIYTTEMKYRVLTWVLISKISPSERKRTSWKFMFLWHTDEPKPRITKKGRKLSPLHTSAWASDAVQGWNTAASWNEPLPSKSLSAETLTSCSNVSKTRCLLKTTIEARNGISSIIDWEGFEDLCECMNESMFLHIFKIHLYSKTAD